jgi:hypothetical protein
MKRLLLSFVLGLALCALGSSSAMAAGPEGAQKAPLFEQPAEPEDGCIAGGPPGRTSGFAVLNTPGNEMAVAGEVSLKRAAPHTTYDVIVEQHFEPGETGCFETFAGTLTTNKKGNGNAHINVARVPTTTTFSVELEGVFGEPEFVTSEVELD